MDNDEESFYFPVKLKEIQARILLGLVNEALNEINMYSISPSLLSEELAAIQLILTNALPQWHYKEIKHD